MLGSQTVLIVSPDPLYREKTEEIVGRIGLQSVSCVCLTEARSLIERQVFQLVCCSDDLPDCNLRTAIHILKSFIGNAPVIVLSHLAEWDSYLRALDAGASDYIACPPNAVEMERILRLALGQTQPPIRASHASA